MRTSNHPEKEITVSAWFFTDSYAPQEIISTCHNGGYCLGFGDAGDLWWTVHLPGEKEVSVNVQHEGIALDQWHHVTGVYDGETSRIYLDGTLRNRVNATGPIVYTTPNYVIIGAQAGHYDRPDPACPRWFRGGLDEIRIYDRAIPYTQIMDDRFACEPGPAVPSLPAMSAVTEDDPCDAPSGMLRLLPDTPLIRTPSFPDKETTGEWHLMMQPGSTLVVETKDLYCPSDPDAWYVEIADKNGRIDRSVAFPGTHNTPVDGLVADGNATARIRYFDGKERFPASAEVTFTAIAPPPPLPEPPKTILDYPVIVIYSASWATLIAIVLVILWLHRRRMYRKQAQEEEKKQD